jgi:broad specificity phosphatase PhoE
MAKKILFIRHGESESNAGGKTDHPQSINLTEQGREQAKAKAAGLSVTPDLIVTSSYIRTKQTAEPFLARFQGVPTDEWNIHEFTFLSAEKYKDTTNEQRRPALMAYWNSADPDYRDGDTAESFNDFVGRCRDTIEKMKDVEADTVLVFCHGYTMNCLRYILEGKLDGGVTPQNMFAFWDYHAEQKIDNCDTLEFRVDGDKVSLVTTPPPPPRPAGKKVPSPILD